MMRKVVHLHGCAIRVANEILDNKNYTKKSKEIDFLRISHNASNWEANIRVL